MGFWDWFVIGLVIGFFATFRKEKKDGDKT